MIGNTKPLASFFSFFTLPKSYYKWYRHVNVYFWLYPLQAHLLDSYQIICTTNQLLLGICWLHNKCLLLGSVFCNCRTPSQVLMVQDALTHCRSLSLSLSLMSESGQMSHSRFCSCIHVNMVNSAVTLFFFSPHGKQKSSSLVQGKIFLTTHINPLL